MIDVLARHFPALAPAMQGRRQRVPPWKPEGQVDDMAFEPIFEPLRFRNLTVKNRIFRSNVSGRFDNYDGSGNQARINWETKFAKGGVGAIISSFVPVHLRGRIVPNYAMIDNDRHIPFWRAVGEAVHEHDCKFILQLSHGGRQRDINGIEYPKGLSSTDKSDPLHGFACERMTMAQINEIGRAVRRGRAARARGRARRRRAARRQRLPDHAVPQLGDQRPQGRVRRPAREPRPLRARGRPRDPRPRRQRLPPADEDQRAGVRRCAAPVRLGPSGNTLAESIQVCKWLVEAGVDALHVSTGSFFPHPRNPAGIGPAGRGSGAQLRHDDLERRAHLRQLPAVPRDVRHRSRAAPGTGPPGRPTRSRARTCRTRARSRRRSRCR